MGSDVAQEHGAVSTEASAGGVKHRRGAGGIAARLGRAAARRHDLAISADVGPDLLQPWRGPCALIVYTSEALDTSDLNSVEAQGKSDANVIIRMPADRCA
jgi:hypothetical protein